MSRNQQIKQKLVEAVKANKGRGGDESGPAGWRQNDGPHRRQLFPPTSSISKPATATPGLVKQRMEQFNRMKKDNEEATQVLKKRHLTHCPSPSPSLLLRYQPNVPQRPQSELQRGQQRHSSLQRSPQKVRQPISRKVLQKFEPTVSQPYQHVSQNLEYYLIEELKTLDGLVDELRKCKGSNKVHQDALSLGSSIYNTIVNLIDKQGPPKLLPDVPSCDEDIASNWKHWKTSVTAPLSPCNRPGHGIQRRQGQESCSDSDASLGRYGASRSDLSQESSGHLSEVSSWSSIEEDTSYSSSRQSSHHSEVEDFDWRALFAKKFEPSKPRSWKPIAEGGDEDETEDEEVGFPDTEFRHLLRQYVAEVEEITQEDDGDVDCLIDRLETLERLVEVLRKSEGSNKEHQDAISLMSSINDALLSLLDKQMKRHDVDEELRSDNK